MASRPITKSFCTSFFRSLKLLPEGFMRIFQVGLLSLFLFLVCSLPAVSQDPPSPEQPPATTHPAPAAPSPATPAAEAPSAPPPASFDDVINRTVQREHLFVAQMRHKHPMVETYLEDLKTDKDGNAIPVKDQYFLGRLDMGEGPEDTSFVGQPGFGQRMVKRLTGLYSLHFLPLGWPTNEVSSGPSPM